ncbi:MAG TPA: hypothetical protein VI248_24160 [Kineosporiaceae bacterium]
MTFEVGRPLPGAVEVPRLLGGFLTVLGYPLIMVLPRTRGGDRARHRPHPLPRR